VIAEGNYRARAIDAQFGHSSQKQTPFVRVRFELQIGNGMTEIVPWTGWFTDKEGKDGRTPSDRSIATLKTCGCTFPDDTITNTHGLDANEVEVVVKHESWETDQGEVRTMAVVSFVNAIGQGGKVRDEDKMDLAKANAFAKSMKANIISARTKRTAPSKAKNGAKPAPAPVPGGDDENDPLPF
jgi:hypothetical protein